MKRKRPIENRQSTFTRCARRMAASTHQLNLNRRIAGDLKLEANRGDSPKVAVPVLRT